MFRFLQFSQGKFWILSILFLLFIFLFFIKSNLLTIPPVWPDEAVAADSAYNLIHQNRIGIDLWKLTVPETYFLGYGYPPFYFYAVAGWFKLFGFSIVNMRLFSAGIGLAFVVSLFYLLQIITKQFTHNKMSKGNLLGLHFLLMLALILNPFFQKAARLGRPEILVMFLASLALIFYYLSIKSKFQNFFFFLSGLSVGLAILTHHSAGIYLISFLLFFLISDGIKTFRSKRFYLFFLPAIIPIFLWIISNYPYFNSFLDLFRKQLKMHGAGSIKIWLAVVLNTLPNQLTGIIYFTISSWYVFFHKKNNSAQNLLVLLILISSWIAAFMWKVEWGFAIIILPTYLALWILINESFKNHFQIKLNQFNILITLTFCLIALNIITQADSLKNFPQGAYSYTKYTDEILKVIPDYKTVYLSAIPDPYFGFKEKRHNTIYQFPMLETSKSNFIKMLNSVDFIIYNQALDSWVVGDISLKYIDKNTKQIYKVGEPGEYSTFVIELKPKDQRITDL